MDSNKLSTTPAIHAKFNEIMTLSIENIVIDKNLISFNNESEYIHCNANSHIPKIFLLNCFKKEKKENTHYIILYLNQSNEQNLEKQ